MHREMDGGQIADHSGLGRLQEITEVRRPAGVLVDRQHHSPGLGQIDQPLPEVQVEYKGFLAQHMLAGLDGRLDDFGTLSRMRGDVDHRQALASKQGAIVLIDPGVRKELIPSRLGAGQVHVAQGNHGITSRAIGGQMMLGDATTPDQADGLVPLYGITRAVGQIKVGRQRVHHKEVQRGVVSAVCGQRLTGERAGRRRTRLVFAGRGWLAAGDST